MGSSGGGIGKALGPIGSVAGGLISMLGGSGSGGGPQYITQPPPAPPAPPAAKALQPDKTNFGAYPEALSPPTWMGINSSMTPEQRSRIATMALAGDNSAYRSDEATNYYKNVAQRSFTDPSGNIIEGAAPLPIEMQYAQDVLGRQLSNDTTANFLTQLLSV